LLDSLLQEKPATQKKDELKSFDLEDIDKICREIDEEDRQKRKRKCENDNTTVINDNLGENTEFHKAVNFKSDMQLGDRQWIVKTVKIVIEHLNKYGACVIDQFLGEERGSEILENFKKLRNAHLFREGQLASNRPGSSNVRYRSDMITWTDGVSPPSPGIKHLIRILDTIVTTANSTSDNGALSDYDICGRTNAMAACYPGEGTHYVKHVDNPKEDGRCITAIYYINKDWEPKRDGGALKIYSSYLPGVVATVDPLFDRVIFFWSDRRNPHEVMPAFRERYAITVWYLDKKEKEKHDEKKESAAIATKQVSP